MGHDLTGWWTGSQLDIHETRELVPRQNATTLQVAASVLGALSWMIRNPREGLCVPDELPHRDVLEVASRYLGPCPSVQTDWTPLRNRSDPFERFGRPRPDGRGRVAVRDFQGPHVGPPFGTTAARRAEVVSASRNRSPAWAGLS